MISLSDSLVVSAAFLGGVYEIRQSDVNTESLVNMYIHIC